MSHYQASVLPTPLLLKNEAIKFQEKKIFFFQLAVLDIQKRRKRKIYANTLTYQMYDSVKKQHKNVS